MLLSYGSRTPDSGLIAVYLNKYQNNMELKFYVFNFFFNIFKRFSFLFPTPRYKCSVLGTMA